MATRLGGVNAARIAAGTGRDGVSAGDWSADAIYDRAAGLLGLFGVAFYGDRGTPAQRRQLRDAWREARRIAALRGGTLQTVPSRHGRTAVRMGIGMDAGTRVLFRYSGNLSEAMRHRGADLLPGDPIIARYDRHTGTIVRASTADEADSDAGPMYAVRFDDGTEGDAFADELEPVR
jgi:hypothetical protein